jgi:hypothetical protein
MLSHTTRRSLSALRFPEASVKLFKPLQKALRLAATLFRGHDVRVFLGAGKSRRPFALHIAQDYRCC